ncbi:hypothetical protein [Bradyrhizobium sp. BR 1432]|uniref:hypothetical protein n=1 Tax=Bradyrhizobium sp. BR 1432 TaxID=3447966 RepID=UPI003EE80C03
MIAGLLLVAPAMTLPIQAAIDPATGPRYMGHASADRDQWQRIDFRSERLSVRTAQHINVAIQTRGPAMQGLIRIPGCPVHRRLRTPSKLISQIECLDKRVDHANGVVLVNEIIEAFGQQRPLPHDPPLQRSAS